MRFERDDRRFAVGVDDDLVKRNFVTGDGFGDCVGDDGVPFQRRGRSGRGVDGRGQAGRSGRRDALELVGAEVDSTGKARVPGQVGRKRFGDVGVIALVERLRTVGEAVVAVRGVFEERLRRVVDVVVRRTESPTGKTGKRVMRFDNVIVGIVVLLVVVIVNIGRVGRRRVESDDRVI